MEQMEFFIEEIICGWFAVCCKGSDWEVHFRASDAWGIDAPALLLQELTMQMNGNLPSAIYVIFDEEPGIYLFTLSQKNTRLATVEVVFSKCDDDELPEIDRSGRKTLSELANLILIDNVLLRAEIDYEFFAQSVYKAFLPFETVSRNQYEENWMPFPEKEWIEYKKCLTHN